MANQDLFSPMEAYLGLFMTLKTVSGQSGTTEFICFQSGPTMSKFFGPQATSRTSSHACTKGSVK